MLIGILGGMGPEATVCCMRQIQRMTQASCDQDHVPLLVYNYPAIPDRTAYILDPAREDPRPALIAGARTLSAAGADCIGIACVTAHYFCEDIQAAVAMPLISMIDETVSCLSASGIRRVGLMATSGTLATGLFHHALTACGMEPVVPAPAAQDCLMDLIYSDLKTGRPADMDKFNRVSENLLESGAEVIVLGCTDLSILWEQGKPGPGYLDALSCLSRRLVLESGFPLRGEYRHLL